MTSKGTLGLCCILAFPTNDSYNKCIHGWCLPCHYVTMPFGILQRVIKTQRVLISPYIWTQQKSISLLSEIFVATFSNIILNFKFSGLINSTQDGMGVLWGRRGREALGYAKRPCANFSPVSPVNSTNVNISPRNFLTFSFNPFPTLVENFKTIPSVFLVKSL